MSGLSCMWYLVPWPGIEPGTLALGAWSLSYWSIIEVSCNYILMFIYIVVFIYQDSSNCTQKYTSTTWKKKTNQERSMSSVTLQYPPYSLKDYSLSGFVLILNFLDPSQLYSRFGIILRAIFPLAIAWSYHQREDKLFYPKIRTTGLQSRVSDDFT